MNKTFIFKPLIWQQKDVESLTGEIKSEIWAYGRSDDKLQKHFRINDFPELIRVELPSRLNRIPVNWDEDMERNLSYTLRDLLKDDSPIHIRIEYLKPIHGFLGGHKNQVATLYFNSRSSVYKCTKVLKDPIPVGRKYYRLNVVEEKVTSVCKFLTAANLKYSSVIQLKARSVPPSERKRVPVYHQFTPGSSPELVEAEFYVSWKDIQEVENDTTVFRWSVLGMDVETRTPNHKRVPKPQNCTDACYMCSIGFIDPNFPHRSKEYCIIWGECNDIPDVEIIRVERETDIQKAFSRIVLECDPDCLPGYNSMGYDNPYLDFRLKRKGLEWDSMGRVMNEPVEIKEMSWQSSAYGNVKMTYFILSGRIVWDQLLYHKRAPDKLLLYNLNFVSEHYGVGSKNDMPAVEMFEIYDELYKYAREWRSRLLSIRSTGSDVLDTDEDIGSITCLDLNEEGEEVWEDGKIDVGRRKDFQEREDIGIDYKETGDGADWDDTEEIQTMNELGATSKWIPNVHYDPHTKNKLTGVFGGIILEDDATETDVELMRVKFTDTENKEELLNTHSRLRNSYERYQIAVGRMTKVAAYCVQDTRLVIKLMDKLEVLIEYVELANVVNIDIFDLLTRGQQIRCYALIYGEAYRSGYYIDPYIDQAMSYKGGFVGDPKKGLHNNIVCYDFASMYPSIMRMFNMCYSSFIFAEMRQGFIDNDLMHMVHVFKFEEWVRISKSSGPSDDSYAERDYDPNGSLKDALSDGVTDEEKEKMSKAGKEHKVIEAWFVKKEYMEELMKIRQRKQNKDGTVIETFEADKQYGPDGKEVKPEGLLPRILTRLVDARGKAKSAMKQHPEGSFLHTMYNGRQLALKIVGNSVYGFTGVPNGLLPFILIAICVTYMARKLIGDVNQFLIEKHNGEVCYNDTDSVFIDFHIEDSIECYKHAKKVEKEINTVILHEPLKVEMEKMVKVLFIKKKHYAWYQFCPESMMYLTGEEDLHVKGIPLAKREHCKLLTGLYRKCLVQMLFGANYLTILDIIVDRISEIINDRHPDVANFVAVRQVGGPYSAKSTYFMKAYTEILEQRGTPASSGDRLQWVCVRRPTERLLGRRIESPEYFLESQRTESPLEIDIMYYIKRIQKPVDTLFEACFGSEFESFESRLFYKATRLKARARKPRDITSPVEMIIFYLEDGNVGLDTFKEFIHRRAETHQLSIES
jgi:DNA polymerase elongation subunit (family B)